MLKMRICGRGKHGALTRIDINMITVIAIGVACQSSTQTNLATKCHAAHLSTVEWTNSRHKLTNRLLYIIAPTNCQNEGKKTLSRRKGI